jgi:glycosyltransferase involved in cell wall biosynthesis
MKRVTAIIPTINEEENIEKCIKSVSELADKIVVVDTYSSDRTKEIAESLGCTVYQGNWSTFAEKINWSIQNIAIETEWVMRLDADEVLGQDFVKTWKNTPLTADAYSIKRKFVFLGKELNFGGWGGLWDVRIWKPGHVSMENRAIDEHMIVSGKLERLHVKVLDDSHKSVKSAANDDHRSIISFWIEKHNKYSDLEAKAFRSFDRISGTSDFSAKIKRILKNNVYYKIPLFVRPFLFFFYRYFILLGFLDGRRGLIIHVLHSFWYRFLVDVKIYERSRNPR